MLPEDFIINPGRTSNTGIIIGNTGIANPGRLPRKTLLSLPRYNPDLTMTPMRRAFTAKQRDAMITDEARRRQQDIGLLRAIRYT